MVLEFFTAAEAQQEGQPLCEGKIELGTRFFYLPYVQMRSIVTALKNKKSIGLHGLVHDQTLDIVITGVDWSA